MHLLFSLLLTAHATSVNVSAIERSQAFNHARGTCLHGWNEPRNQNEAACEAGLRAAYLNDITSPRAANSICRSIAPVADCVAGVAAYLDWIGYVTDN